MKWKQLPIFWCVSKTYTAMFPTFKILFLQEFLEKFSELEPCVLSRSIAQVLYLGTGNNSSTPSSVAGGSTGDDSNKLWGGHTMADTLREAARQFISPPALIPKAPVLNNPQVRYSTHSYCVKFNFSTYVVVIWNHYLTRLLKLSNVKNTYNNALLAKNAYSKRKFVEKLGVFRRRVS